MANLWLFDIDGVLVNITKDSKKDPHLKAYQRDYREVLGIGVPATLITATYGKTEVEMQRHIFSQSDITSQLMERGISVNDDIRTRLKDAHLPHIMEELRAFGPIEPLDGVVEFLTYLQRHRQYRGVVTGNLKRPTEYILEKSGLRKFFSIISCDDGIKTREQVVQGAIDEARRLRYAYERLIVIGDTKRDIDAGKYVSAFTVGVATGSDSIQELKRANPDVVIQTLRDYPSILRKLK